MKSNIIYQSCEISIGILLSMLSVKKTVLLISLFMFFLSDTCVGQYKTFCVDSGELYWGVKYIVDNDILYFENFKDKVRFNKGSISNSTISVNSLFSLNRRQELVKRQEFCELDSVISNTVIKLCVDMYVNHKRKLLYGDNYLHNRYPYESYKKFQKMFDGSSVYDVGKINYNTKYDTYILALFKKDTLGIDIRKLLLLNVKGQIVKSIVVITSYIGGGGSDGDEYFTRTTIDKSNIFCSEQDSSGGNMIVEFNNIREYITELINSRPKEILISKYYIDNNGHVQFAE